MARRHVSFPCEGEQLTGTIDEAPGTAGLLIVTGGNETRAGAFSGQAQLAARIAAAGHPVFRFDRRGVGDSPGKNLGFRGSAADIAAALSAFRAHSPHLVRVVGFGNCDAASILMLEAGSGFDVLALANPWTIESGNEALPPAAVRARYGEKLRNPREVLRLFTGKVSLSKLAAGIRQALRPARVPSSLAQEMAAGLAHFSGPTAILLAGRDRTAQAFVAAWDGTDDRIALCPNASHAFVEPDAREWLSGQLLRALSQE